MILITLSGWQIKRSCWGCGGQSLCQVQPTLFKGHPLGVRGQSPCQGQRTLFGVRLGLGQVRLGQVRSGQVRLGQVKLGQVWLGQVRVRQVRLGTLVNPQKDLQDKSQCTLVDKASVLQWTKLVYFIGPSYTSVLQWIRLVYFSGSGWCTLVDH